MSRTAEHAIVVIHGVADQRPGETLESVAALLEPPSGKPGRRATIRLTPSLPPPSSLLRSTDPLTDTAHEACLAHSKAGGAHAEFDVPSIHGVPLTADLEGTKVDLFEVHWADLSRPPAGLIGTIRAFLGIVLHLPIHGRRGLEASAKMPKASLLLERAAWLTRSAVVPLSFAGTALLAALLLISFVIRHADAARVAAAASLAMLGVLAWSGLDGFVGFRTTARAVALAACAAITALLIALFSTAFAMLTAIPLIGAMSIAGLVVGRSVYRSEQFADEARRGVWTAVIVVPFWVALVVVAWTHSGLGSSSSPEDFARILVQPTLATIELAYVLLMLAFAGAVACSLLSVAAMHTRRGAADGGMLRRAARTALLGHLVPWLTLVMVAVPTLAALLTLMGPALPNEIEVESTILEPLLRYVAGAPREQVETHLKAMLFAAATRLLGPILVVMGIAAVLFGFALAPILRVLVSTRENPSAKTTKRDDRRAGAWLEFATSATPPVVTVIAFVAAFMFLVGWTWDAIDCVRSYLNPTTPGPAGTEWITGAVITGLGVSLAGSAGLLAFPSRIRELLEPLAPAFDVAGDVDAYLRPRERSRILGRCHAVLEHARKRGYRSILVLAHSQGTLIAVDTLRIWGSPKFPGEAPRVDLITLGSPLTNLYHRFFPFRFPWVPQLVRHGWQEGMAVHIASWTNLYSRSDYIGRRLRCPPPSCETKKPTHRARNEAFPAVGHNGYLSRRSGTESPLVTAIRAVLACRRETANAHQSHV